MPQDTVDLESRKTIRSFVLRQGRITKAQQLAFENYWQHYGIDFTGELLNIENIFQNNNKQIIVEIGFGNGKSLAQMAFENPNTNYIGVEVHGPGVGSLLIEIDRLKLTNIKCFHHDAIEIFNIMLPDNCINGLQLFFPDPWPKKKHHKRRIVKPEFLDLVLLKLVDTGRFHMATDWWPYAEDAMEVLTDYKGLQNEMDKGEFSPRPKFRPKTKFEERGENLGHGVWDLIFQKDLSYKEKV
jgi:tRNA (guanine-N7-)-methyltransferase